jgi:uncharacterized delta-60 repeat protein
MIDQSSLIRRPRPKSRRTSLQPAIEALEGRALLSTAGTPDSTYGTLGFSQVTFGSADFSLFQIILSGEAVQSDGKAVVVGYATPEGPTFTRQGMVERLDADGSADPTFGTNGVVTLPVTANSITEVNWVAIQPDGKIVVVGSISNNLTENTEISLYRLDSDGSLDPTFGTGGVVNFSFVAGSTTLESEPTSLILQTDGKIVVGGGASLLTGDSDLVALARFDANGSLDTTFGTSGEALVPTPGTSRPTYRYSQGVDGLAIQSDGKIDFETSVVPASGTGTQIVVGRLDADGSTDTTFGTAGQTILAGSDADTASGLGLQPDGQIIAVGQYADLDTAHLDVYRLNTDGTVDTTFGTRGFGIAGETILDAGAYNTNSNDPAPAVTAFLVQPDGKIVLGATIPDLPDYPTDTQTVVHRLNADGSPDLSFGSGGKDLIPFSVAGDAGVGGIIDLAIQADGKLLGETYGGVIRMLAGGATNDFNGDGTTDLAVLLPNFAAPIFAYRPSGAVAGSPDVLEAFGIAGAGQTLPAPGAYDGAGIDELGVYLPSIGAIAYRTVSTTGFQDNIDYIGPKGIGQAIAASADYTGSGHTEIGVYDVATGSFIYSPDNSSSTSGEVTVPFGIPGAGQSIPVPADYFGTGQDDIAVYLAASGVWAIQDPSGKTSGEVIAFGPQGIGNAIPAPADYDNSGHIELGLYLPSIGAFAYLPYNGGPAVITAFGMPGAGKSIPVPGDYDGSGHSELAVYMPSLDAFAYRPYGGGPDVSIAFGEPGVGNTIPFTATGAEAFGGGGGGGNAFLAPRTSGGLDGSVDFVPDLAGQARKAANGGSSAISTRAQS